jgi:L-aspartate-alpha-decarboxylase
MTRKMLRAKIHRATVTQADVDYEGSITIDRRLLDATDLLPNEAVCVWNVTNGNRFETYAVEGPPDSGVICVNGAAAHLVDPGDLVIIAALHVDGRGSRTQGTSPKSSSSTTRIVSVTSGPRCPDRGGRSR